MNQDVLKGLARPQGRGLCLARSQGRGIRLARPRGHGLRLARPLGYGLRLARPQGRSFPLAQGRGLRLARPLGCGLRLTQPRGRGFRLIRRGPIPPPTTLGPSVWAWVKTLTPGKRLAHLDVTRGNDGPHLGIHIKNSVGRAGAIHHDVRQDEVERHDLQMTPAYGASDE